MRHLELREADKTELQNLHPQKRMPPPLWLKWKTCWLCMRHPVMQAARWSALMNDPVFSDRCLPNNAPPTQTGRIAKERTLQLGEERPVLPLPAAIEPEQG